MADMNDMKKMAEEAAAKAAETAKSLFGKMTYLVKSATAPKPADKPADTTPENKDSDTKE